MKRGCLRRRTLKAIAAGQCPPADLAKIRRHLPRCPRCQAAMVKAASDPLWGDTVEDPPPCVTRRRSAELLAVGASLLAAVGAWRYAAPAPALFTPPAVVSSPAAPSRLEAARPHTDPCPVGAQPPPSPPEAVSLTQPANRAREVDELATPLPREQERPPAVASIRHTAEQHLTVRAQPAPSTPRPEPLAPASPAAAAPETSPSPPEELTVLGRVIRTSLD